MTLNKNKIDYANIEIDPKKSKKDYTFAERRAEILKLVFKLGSPGLINRTKLAEIYSVSAMQICHDLDALGEYTEKNLGKRAILRIESGFGKSIDNMIRKEKDLNVIKGLDSWIKWLFEKGALKKVPEKTDSEIIVKWKDAKMR